MTDMIYTRISDWHDAFSAIHVMTMEYGVRSTEYMTLDYCLLSRVCYPKGGRGGTTNDARVSRWL